MLPYWLGPCNGEAPMIAETELLALSDSNLAEAQREHARWMPNHLIEERDGMLFSAAGTRAPAAPFNAVQRAGPERTAPERVLAEARAFFAARNRGFSVHVRSHVDADLQELVEREGFVNLSGRCPGMALTEALPAPGLGSGAEFRTVDDAKSGRDFAEISALAYEPIGLSPAVTRKVFSFPERWLVPHWHVRIVYEQGAPVAAAMVLFSHGIAGLYWVGTVPSARGRGHAEAVVRDVSRHAFERGARAVVLQASALGEPIYRRIGFREFTSYPWYLAVQKA
jgi:GNAT superfamily N-acetyltransferase